MNAKTVECNGCHRVYVPTPMDDYYTPAGGGPQVCITCLIGDLPLVVVIEVEAP